MNKLKGALSQNKETAAETEQDAGYAEQAYTENPNPSSGRDVTFSQPNFSQTSTGPAPTLETFLAGAKAHLQKTIKDKDRVTLVMGDEHAGMLNSYVSLVPWLTNSK